MPKKQYYLYLVMDRPEPARTFDDVFSTFLTAAAAEAYIDELQRAGKVGPLWIEEIHISDHDANRLKRRAKYPRAP